MFVFHNLKDLILLHHAKMLQLIVDTGVKIMVPEISRTAYSAPFWVGIDDIAKKGWVSLKDSDDTCFEFVMAHARNYRFAGKPLLALMHFCRQERAVLIVDDDETLVRTVCAELNVNTCSLLDFNRATINNNEYFEFIMEVKESRY